MAARLALAALISAPWSSACHPEALPSPRTPEPAIEATPARTATPLSPPAVAAPPSAPPPIAWVGDRNAALEDSRRTGRPLLVFVVAAWQPRAEELERDLWSDDDLRRAATDLVALRIDASDTKDGVLEHWLAERGLEHVPSVGLFDPSGRSLGRLRGPQIDKPAVLRLLRRR